MGLPIVEHSQMDAKFPRREERSEVSWIAAARFADGVDVPCTVKDVSSSGMRLAIAHDVDLPDAFMVKIVGRDLVMRVKTAWRRGYDTGVVIEKIAKLPPRQDVPPETEPRRIAADHHVRLGSRGRFGTLA